VVEKILITGGAGFIGSNFIKYMLEKYPAQYINFDKLTYAGNKENLREIENWDNYQLIQGDLCDLNFLCHLLKDIDVIFNFAAESHVDNSIGNSLIFSKSNILGTHTLLEAARLCKVKRIIHISTDEVYGDIEEGSFKEEDKLSPNNPYSATKAAAEMIVKAYRKTYNLPIIMVRGNNAYGPYQYPEKIIPICVINPFQGKKIPLHGDGSNIRSFIYVKDFCEAVFKVFEKGEIGEVYNIGTNDEIRNIDLIKKILTKLGKDESYIEFVQDRPFNDKRYSIDLTKIKSLGWTQNTAFEEGLDKTINWYRQNQDWWKKIEERPKWEKIKY